MSHLPGHSYAETLIQNVPITFCKAITNPSQSKIQNFQPFIVNSEVGNRIYGKVFETSLKENVHLKKPESLTPTKEACSVPNAGWYPVVKMIEWSTNNQISDNQQLIRLNGQKLQAVYPLKKMETEPQEKKQCSSLVDETGVKVAKVQKAKMSIFTYKSIQANLKLTRNIGALLTISGAITIGLGIAGIIFYHLGRNGSTNLPWCKNPHAEQNSVTKTLLSSSPSINYAASGAGFLGVSTLMVGILTMFLFKLYGTLSYAAMYMSFINIGIMPVMAILAILSFIMTFPDFGTPSCLPLTIVNAGVVLFSVIPLALLLTIYFKMKKLFKQIREDPTVTKSSIEKLQSINNVRDVSEEIYKGYICACECCPCCAGRTNPNGCCPGCCGNDVTDIYKKDILPNKKNVEIKSSLCKRENESEYGYTNNVVHYPFANGMHILKPFGGHTGYYGNSIYNSYAFTK